MFRAVRGDGLVRRTHCALRLTIALLLIVLLASVVQRAHARGVQQFLHIGWNHGLHGFPADAVLLPGCLKNNGEVSCP